MRPVAQPLEREVQDRRRDARAAGRDDRAREVDAGRREGGRKAAGVLHRPVGVHQRAVVQVHRPRDVPATQAGARLGLLAREPPRRAGVGDLPVAQLGGGRDLGDVAHQMRLALDGDVAVAHHRRHVLGLAPLGQPFGQAAVQNRDVGLAHQPEQPPDAGGREQPRGIVDHHVMAVAHAHGAQPRDELLGRRGHVRQRRAAVGDLVDVEEAGGGDVGGGVFGPRVAAGGRHVPGGVEHPQVGVAQMGGEPVGGDERPGVVGRHGHPSR